MKQLITILLTASILSSCNQIVIDNPDISKDELFNTISFLSSDSLKGRKPGTPEGKIAAEFIATELTKFGYKPLNENPFQYFEVVTNSMAGENNSLTIGDYNATLNEDFIPYNFSSNATVSANVAFCGYGFNLAEDSLSWNDFENIDVSGKWALILRADPDLDNPDSKYIPYSREESKILNAKDQGAAGVLFVSGEDFDKKDELIKMEIDQSMSNFGIPAFHIKRSLADKILAESGKTIAGLEKELTAQMNPASFDVDITVNASSEVLNNKVNTQNVVMWLPCSNNGIKDEYILFGGHYDHLGLGGPNSGSRTETEVGIHHGADDNASGVASIIEIAEKLAANKSELQRNVIIMAFGAEEIGLLGSKYFTSNAPVELSKIKAMVNLDMIGRLKPSKELIIGGTGTAVESETLLDSLGKSYDLTFSFSSNGYGPSDHSAFYAENIPVFFFTTGPHSDYHTPRDIVDSINFAGLVEISNYTYALGYNLLNREKNLTYQEAGPKGIVKQGRKSTVKLGIMPNFGKSDNTGLRVDAVTPEGAAHVAGMLKGDVIVAIEGKEIHNIYEYMERMSKLRFGQTVNVDVVRESERKVLLVQLEQKN